MVDNIEKVDDKKREERIQHTDIKITAFLWCDEIALSCDDGSIKVIRPNISLEAVKRNINKNSNSFGQCLFYLINRGDIPFRPLIMAYYNERALVSPKAFTQKLNDLKDLINQRVA